MKALVVDDSKVMCQILKKHLKLIEFDEIDVAHDGKSAVKIAAENKYDIILMDWNMPELNGIEALIQIRTTDQRTPIIMVTTEAEAGRLESAKKAGADDYVIKPFTDEQIQGKILKAMQNKR